MKLIRPASQVRHEYTLPVSPVVSKDERSDRDSDSIWSCRLMPMAATFGHVMALGDLAQRRSRQQSLESRQGRHEVAPGVSPYYSPVLLVADADGGRLLDDLPLVGN